MQKAQRIAVTDSLQYFLLLEHTVVDEYGDRFR